MCTINILATLAQTINKTCLVSGWFLGGCSSFLAGFGWLQVSLTYFSGLSGLGSDRLDILSSE